MTRMEKLLAELIALPIVNPALARRRPEYAWALCVRSVHHFHQIILLSHEFGIEFTQGGRLKHTSPIGKREDSAHTDARSTRK
jgi:hypothetical protein